MLTTRDAGAEQEGEDGAEQRAARGQYQDPLLGLADASRGFRFQPPLPTKEIGLHCGCTLHDGSRRAIRYGHELIHHLAVGDDLFQRVMIGTKRGLASFKPATMLSSDELTVPNDISTNFSRASAVFAGAWSKLRTKFVAAALALWNWKLTCLVSNSIAFSSACRGRCRRACM